jgi:hypothetical protein
MFKGYRTFMVSLMVAIFGILQMTNWDAFFADPKAGAVALASAIIMAVMRLFTTTPPGQATPPAPTSPTNDGP